MTKARRIIRQCLMVVFMLLQPFVSTAVVVAVASTTMACAAVPIAQQYPQAQVVNVCVRPPGVEPDAWRWVYADTGAVVSSEHPEVFDRIARTAERIYEHDQDASPKSVQSLPRPHNELVCPDRFRPLPPAEVDEKLWLPPEEWMFIRTDAHCQLLRDKMQQLGVAGPYIGQAPDVKSGWFCGARPLVPDPAKVARDDARQKGKEIGKQLGELFGDAIEGPKTMTPDSQRAFARQLKVPEYLNHYQQKFAEKLNAIPQLPTYEDVALARAALEGFEVGYGEGIAEAHAKALAVGIAAQAALALSGNVAGALESLGAKALTAAIARLRGMPMFVPGSTSGVGFFLRIPKPPPANANAPSLPVGAPPPPAGTPPPFGNLSRAAEFGIQAESSLAKAIAKTGLEKHHLIEQRLTDAFIGDPRLKLTVAVTAAEHQAFTNAWRQRIAYGTPLPSKDVILKHAREIYANYPAILKALGL